VLVIPPAKKSMTVRVFVDTNVLVYSRDASEPEKQKQAMSWVAHLWSLQTGRLSFQVLQEFYATVTQKLQPGMDPQSARDDIRALFSWRPIPIDARIMEGAWPIQDRYKLSCWDALIVSAAQIADCRYLLTEDLQENQNFGNVQVINPFHHTPDSLSL
jgi:predicted nucleic acid-binding protein